MVRAQWFGNDGGPDGVRTRDRRIKSLSLYLTKLQARFRLCLVYLTLDAVVVGNAFNRFVRTVMPSLDAITTTSHMSLNRPT